MNWILIIIGAALAIAIIYAFLKINSLFNTTKLLREESVDLQSQIKAYHKDVANLREKVIASDDMFKEYVDGQTTKAAATKRPSRAKKKE